MLHCVVTGVTGVSESPLMNLFSDTDLTELLKKFLADSMSAAMKLTLLPLTSGISDQEPSIRDLEQFWTALASSSHCEKDSFCSAKEPEPVPMEISTGLLGVPGVTGLSITGRSSFADLILLVSLTWQGVGKDPVHSWAEGAATLSLVNKS